MLRIKLLITVYDLICISSGSPFFVDFLLYICCIRDRDLFCGCRSRFPPTKLAVTWCLTTSFVRKSPSSTVRFESIAHCNAIGTSFNDGYHIQTDRGSLFAMLSSRLAQASLRASAHQFSRRAVVNSVRTYAAAAAPDTKPPVALFGIDGTYANALVCIHPPLSLYPTIEGVTEGWHGKTTKLANILANQHLGITKL